MRAAVVAARWFLLLLGWGGQQREGSDGHFEHLFFFRRSVARVDAAGGSCQKRHSYVVVVDISKERRAGGGGEKKIQPLAIRFGSGTICGRLRRRGNPAARKTTASRRRVKKETTCCASTPPVAVICPALCCCRDLHTIPPGPKGTNGANTYPRIHTSHTPERIPDETGPGHCISYINGPQTTQHNNKTTKTSGVPCVSCALHARPFSLATLFIFHVDLQVRH